MTRKRKPALLFKSIEMKTNDKKNRPITKSEKTFDKVLLNLENDSKQANDIIKANEDNEKIDNNITEMFSPMPAGTFKMKLKYEGACVRPKR